MGPVDDDTANHINQTNDQRRPLIAIQAHGRTHSPRNMAPVDTSIRRGAPRPGPQGRPTGEAAADGSTAQLGQSTATPAHPQPPLTSPPESWVEVASQPSSSSLSSLGGDEIVTTGLRVGNNTAYPPRRRRLHQPPQPHPQPVSMPPSYVIGHAAAQAGTSSQEEYDETESEEDRLLTSSTEQVVPPGQQHPTTAIPPMDSDTDSENATALGHPSPAFRPQPNAFSHPPNRPPLTTRHHSSRLPRDFQADNDAALRASLTTLLSCAAAARGLPRKNDNHHPSAAAAGGIGPRGTTGAGVRPSSQPMNLRLVPESELMAEPSPRPTRTASNSSAPSGPASSPEKTKPQHAHAQRTVKKKRTVTETAAAPATQLISPTLLTWVVSAGVVVIFSVVGFGAGYVIGREVGRQEGGAALFTSGGGAGAGNLTASSSCGRELARSGTGGALRRLRWGGGKGVVA